MGDAAQRPEASLEARIGTRNVEMRRLVRHAMQVAATPYPVLVEGETGTGKEVFARGIHTASGRRGAFVPVNCSAVPEAMFEAELFGARRGAYTSLDSERPGLLRVADGGTLFLDEVADLPASVQAKLLRALEDGEIRPLGGTASVKVDVRIITASQRPLASLVEEGRFRRDLFFRLSAVAIRLPPLRERREDIPALVRDAALEASRLQGVPPREFAPDAMSRLMGYSWPGNVRELKHLVASAVLRSTGAMVRMADLPAELLTVPTPNLSIIVGTGQPYAAALAQFERGYLEHLMERANGNLSHAAEMAQLSRSALRERARRYGLVEAGRPPGRPRSR